MERKELYPVDTASFKWIRERGFVYVDKTGYMDIMSREGKFYFLARPRRFGKSLFLNTLHEYFSGNRELFNELAIDRLQPEEWEEYPVIHLNLTGKAFLNQDSLTNLLSSELEEHERKYGLTVSSKDVDDRFSDLITLLSSRFNKETVVLIDEYDAPLSSAIGNPGLQEIYREQLHGFYSVLKKNDDYIRFCMLTGVTRYGKVSVFSGLNNLNDITFNDKFAGICGITEEELHKYYSEGAGLLAEEKCISEEEAFSLLKFHYDGYHFSKSLLDVYNPFSINHALAESEVKDYWCESGLPTILSKTMLENDFPIDDLVGKKVEEAELKNLSIFHSNPVPLFYQTGYLTLKAYDNRRNLFTLGYPNREVEGGILKNILNVYMPDNRSVRVQIYDMQDDLENGEPEKFIKKIGSFLSNIPSKLHERVSRYENYYHTIIYCITQLMGLDIDAEYATSEGFIDILIKTKKFIYIIELKINGTAEDAIEQIERKHYDKPFESDSRRLYKIGIGFSKTTHTIESSIII